MSPQQREHVECIHPKIDITGNDNIVEENSTEYTTSDSDSIEYVTSDSEYDNDDNDDNDDSDIRADIAEFFMDCKNKKEIHSKCKKILQEAVRKIMLNIRERIDRLSELTEEDLLDYITHHIQCNHNYITDMNKETVYAFFNVFFEFKNFEHCMCTTFLMFLREVLEYVYFTCPNNGTNYHLPFRWNRYLKYYSCMIRKYIPRYLKINPVDYHPLALQNMKLAVEVTYIILLTNNTKLIYKLINGYDMFRSLQIFAKNIIVNNLNTNSAVKPFFSNRYNSRYDCCIFSALLYNMMQLGPTLGFSTEIELKLMTLLTTHKGHIKGVQCIRTLLKATIIIVRYIFNDDEVGQQFNGVLSDIDTDD